MGRKFTFAVALLFSLNILLLLGFYGVYLRPNIVNETEEIQENIIRIINETVSAEDAETLIGKIKVNAYNTELRTAISKSLLKKLILFEIAVLLILLLFTGFISYQRYVKPIDLLVKGMENYSKGIRVEIPAQIIEPDRKDEIGKLQREFLTLTQSLETEKQKQNQIIASVSHDIKTPLTVLMGYSERLLKNKVPLDKQEKYLQMMYTKAQSINEIINEFDEYLSYNFEGSLTLRAYSVSYVCQFVQAEYAQELADAGIQFSIENRCTDEKVSLDLLKFKRVIGNLISNSVKHAGAEPAFSLLITPSPQSITQAAAQTPSQALFHTVSHPVAPTAAHTTARSICFHFSDNGKGVAAEELPFIFDPFYTSDKSRKVAGIGLSICKNIITAHSGTIEAYKGKEGGLELKITLPQL